MKALLAFLLLVAVALVALAEPSTREFDFDWTDKNDMRGAYFICSTKGFRGGDCPKVQRKCWQKPLLNCKNGHCKSECTKPPKFSGSPEDAQRAIEHVQEGGAVTPPDLPAPGGPVESPNPPSDSETP